MQRNDTDPDELSKEYIAAAQEDLTEFVEAFYSGSRALDPDYPNERVNYRSTPSLRFDAHVSLDPEKQNVANIDVSLGCLLSIDDLCFRMASNHGFFAPKDVVLANQFDQITPWRVVWPELGVRGNCENVRQGDLLLPKQRFEDYESLTLSETGRKYFKNGRSSFLSGFFAGYPMDEMRHILARKLAMIGLGWLLLHEESHFAEGHFAYTKNRFGIADDSCFEGEEELSGLLRKVMEWHADHGATNGIFDIVFQNAAHFVHGIYPEPSPQDELKTDTLRLMMTGIGMVKLLFRRLELLRGCSEIYPTAFTRLTTLYFTMAKCVRVTRKHFDISPVEFSTAVGLSLEDLAAVSQILGLDNVSGEAGMPMYALEDQGDSARLGMFDCQEDVKKFFLKLMVELGYDAPGLDSHGVTEFGVITEESDVQWFSEYRRIIETFDGTYVKEFLALKPRSRVAR